MTKLCSRKVMDEMAYPIRRRAQLLTAVAGGGRMRVIIRRIYMNITKNTFVLSLIAALLVGTLIGGAYINNRGADAASIGVTTPSQVSITKLPSEEIDVSAGVTEANAVQYGTQVVDDAMAQVAAGIAGAAATSIASTSSPTSKLIDKIIPTAQAFDCGAVVEKATDLTMKYWAPGGASVCAQVNVKAKIAYDVHNKKRDPNSTVDYGLVTITLSDNGSTVSFKDPNCSTKSNSLNLQTRKKYYKWVTGYPDQGSSIGIAEISESEYQKRLKDYASEPGSLENWCKGTLVKVYTIGNVENCPRCNSRRGSGRP